MRLKLLRRVGPLRSPCFCCLFVQAIAISLTSGAAEPQRMIKIVTQLITPGMPQGAFAGKPKTAYLAGTKYGRLEEEFDAENNIHGLLITNEPDSWMINLADNSGRHIIDPGPTFEMHSPIVWAPRAKGQPDPDKYFKNLEFGKEIRFFRQQNARNIGVREVDGRKCKALSLKNGSVEVILLLDPDSGKPYQIDTVRAGKVESSIRYLVYETDLPFDKSLFQPPKGVKIIEQSTAAYVRPPYVLPEIMFAFYLRTFV